MENMLSPITLQNLSQSAPDLQWLEFTMMQKRYAFSRSYTLNFDSLLD